MQVIQSTQIAVMDNKLQPCDYEGYYPPSRLIQDARNNKLLRLGFSKIISDDKEVWYSDFGIEIKLYDTKYE